MGGILLYIKSTIRSKQLKKYVVKNLIEALFTEIRIKSSKWLPCCSYNPNKPQISSHLQELSNGIDTNCNMYENILFIGDFNLDVKEANLHLFRNQY